MGLLRIFFWGGGGKDKGFPSLSGCGDGSSGIRHLDVVAHCLFTACHVLTTLSISPVAVSLLYQIIFWGYMEAYLILSFAREQQWRDIPFLVKGD